MEEHSIWIEVLSLKQGVYEYKFVLDDAFFHAFEHSIIQKANLNAQIQLKKAHYGIDTRLYVEGQVIVPCDICAEEFALPIQAKDEVLYRYKEYFSEQEKKNLEDKEERELRWFSVIDKQINVGQEFYEVAHVKLPMRLCPAQKNGICVVCQKKPEEWLNQVTKSNQDTEDIDPRWNDLKKIKF
ncbi:MAG: DUF177 domain-containing protein [Bacteroidia bacterium]|nr:DUF177 domain-containing protein [Bacteroidia bacterium]MDW8301746.1 DUF177 domain-containing protein [Bacteroidia bacterium]